MLDDEGRKKKGKKSFSYIIQIFFVSLLFFFLPGWMDVTCAPVESQAAWKPKSLLLLGFWFRMIRISQ